MGSPRELDVATRVRGAGPELSSLCTWLMRRATQGRPLSPVESPWRVAMLTFRSDPGAPGRREMHKVVVTTPIKWHARCEKVT